MVGALTLRNPGLPEGKHWNYALGFRHDNGMRMSNQFYTGARITVCTNGMISGEPIYAHKHTVGYDIVADANRIIGEYLKRSERVTADMGAMKQFGITRKDADHLLCEAGSRGIMPWSRIGKVHNEYMNPTFSEFNENDNAWALYNACTYVVQEASEAVQVETIKDFGDFILEKAVA